MLWLGLPEHSFMCHTSHLNVVRHGSLPRHRLGNQLVAKCTPFRLAGLDRPEPDGLHRVHDLLHGQASLRPVGWQPALPAGRAAPHSQVICPKKVLLDISCGGLSPCPTLCCCLAGPCGLPYPLLPVTQGQAVTWVAARQALQSCKASLDLAHPMCVHRRRLLGHSSSYTGQTKCSYEMRAPGGGWRVSQPQCAPLCHGFLEGSRLVVQQALWRWGQLRGR